VRARLHVAGKVAFFIGLIWLNFHIIGGGHEILWPSIVTFGGLFLAATTE